MTQLPTTFALPPINYPSVGARLTNEQAGLFRQNLPAVVDGMAPSGGNRPITKTSTIANSSGPDSDVPPSYDFKS